MLADRWEWRHAFRAPTKGPKFQSGLSMAKIIGWQWTGDFFKPTLCFLCLKMGGFIPKMVLLLAHGQNEVITVKYPFGTTILAWVIWFNTWVIWLYTTIIILWSVTLAGTVKYCIFIQLARVSLYNYHNTTIFAQLYTHLLQLARYYTGWGPRSIAFSWHINDRILWFMVDITN